MIFGCAFDQHAYTQKHVSASRKPTLAPDRGAWGYQTGSSASHMAFRGLRGPRVQELKPSSFLPISSGGFAGMLKSATKFLVLVGPQGDSLGAFRRYRFHDGPFAVVTTDVRPSLKLESKQKE